MAVIQAQGGGGGPLSMLGGLATVAGGFAGAPAWLGALGTGLTAADSLLNGGGSGGAGGLGNTGMTMKDILQGLGKIRQVAI